MNVHVELIEHDALKIRLSETAKEVTMTWIGTSDARNPDVQLRPVIDEVLGRAKGKSVTIDLRALEYMNSATLSPILALVKSLAGVNVTTRLLYDTSKEWQRLNSRCMVAIARTLPNVSVERS